MKHTYTKLRATLKGHEADALLVMMAAVFVGISAAQYESGLSAHFFQRMRTTEKVTVQPSFGTASRQTVALGLTDELREAAPDEAPSSAEEAVSSAAIAESSSQAAQRSSADIEPAADVPAVRIFPALETAVHPVSKVPNWGAMRTAAQWNRTYSQMGASDFVTVPAYDLKTLTIPLSSLTNPIKPSSIPILTSKLYYSTRYLGKYDLDADEHSGSHDGIDLKLALGTPVGATAGGRVVDVDEDNILGKHVLIEHRSENGTRYLSIYAHLQSASVERDQDVAAGQTVGRVGMTGNTSAPHLHFAVHQKQGEGEWNKYDMTESINPIDFIARY